MKKIGLVLLGVLLVSCSAREVGTSSLSSEVRSFPLVAGQTMSFKSNVMLLWKEDLTSEQIIMTRKSLGDLGEIKIKEGKLKKDAAQFKAELTSKIQALEPENQQKWVMLTKKFEQAYAQLQMKQARMEEIMALPPEERDLEEVEKLNEEMTALKKEVGESHEGKKTISAELFGFEMQGKQALGARQAKLKEEAAFTFQMLSKSADLLSHPSKGVGPSEVLMSVDDRGSLDVTLEGLNIKGCVGDGLVSSMANADARRNGVVENVKYIPEGGRLSFEVHLDCGLRFDISVSRSGAKMTEFTGGLKTEREGKSRVGLAVFR